MKIKSLFIIRSIVALLLGLLFIFWSDEAGRSLVIIIGAIFAVAGIVYIVNYFTGKRDAESDADSSLLLIGGIGSLLFGAVLIAAPTVFIGTLMVLLGFILVLAGISQMVSLTKAKKWTNIPIGYFITPTLILIAGVAIIVKPVFVANIVFIVLGVSFITYAISEFVNGLKINKQIQ